MIFNKTNQSVGHPAPDMKFLKQELCDRLAMQDQGTVILATSACPSSIQQPPLIPDLHLPKS